MATTETRLHDEIRSFLDGLTVDGTGDGDAELTFEDLDGVEPESELEAEKVEALPSGIRSHQLYCRQGVGQAYAWDDSWFRPPFSCEMWTRVQFLRNYAHLYITPWRYKGGGNNLNRYGNRWAYRNASVNRARVYWLIGVSDGQGGYGQIQTFSNVLACS